MSMWCLASQDPTAHQYTVHSSYLHSWVIFSIHFVPEHSPWLLQFIQMRKTDFKCVFVYVILCVSPTQAPFRLSFQMIHALLNWVHVVLSAPVRGLRRSLK